MIIIYGIREPNTRGMLNYRVTGIAQTEWTQLIFWEMDFSLKFITGF